MKALSLGILGLFLIFGGCGDDPHASGGQETQTRGGIRIVVLSPAFSQTLVHLGYQDVIVGRHAWDRVLGEEVPIVGDQLGIDVERLSKLDATTVVIERTVGGPADDLRELSDRMGFELVEIPSLALEEVAESFAALDRVARGVTADEPLSDRAREILERWDDVLGDSDTPTGLNLGRTLSIVTVNSGIGVTGPGSFTAEIVERIGGEAIPNEGLPYQTLTVEDIFRLRVETIILYTNDLGTFANAPLPAIQQGRVIRVDNEGLIPSVGLIDLVGEIQRAAESFGPVEGGEE